MRPSRKVFTHWLAMALLLICSHTGWAQNLQAINMPVPAGWTLVNYFTGTSEANNDGWINGKNIYQDKEKAMYFDLSGSSYGSLFQIWIGFGKAASAHPERTVPVKVYDGTSGTPGALLVSYSGLTMQQIINDVTNSVYTAVPLPITTLPASRKIFVSVDLTNLQFTAGDRDVLSIVSNSAGETSPSAIWEKQADNNWYHYTTAGSWNLSASLLIHPLVGNVAPDAGGRLYVAKGYSSNGQSWNDALGELADALKWARLLNDTTPGRVKEIWVAGGTYLPLYSPRDGAGFASEGADNSFALVKDVQVYGGFGSAATTVADRDPAAYPTILGGDIGTPGDPSDDAYHVAVSAGTMGSARLDGFAIAGGNARGSGAIMVNGQNLSRDGAGGLLIQGGAPAVFNTIFSGNQANGHGGGLLSVNASPAVVNSAFWNNTAGAGGGAIASESGDGTFTNITSSGNGAQGLYLRGATTWNNALVWDAVDGTYSASRSLFRGSTDSTNGNVGDTGWSASDIFTNAAGNDFSLKPGSPAVDSGDDALYASAGGNAAADKDRAGRPRLSGPRIDIGAYEWQGQTQTITASNLTKTYGDADFTHGTASSGLALAYASSNPAVVTVAGGQLHIVGAGTTTITAHQGGDATYHAADDVSFILTVNPAPLSVIADALSKTRGTADPVLTYAVDGFVNGDGSALMTGALQRAPGETPGTYAIGQGTLSAGANYLIAYTGASFTVKPAAAPTAVPTLSEWGLIALSGLLLIPLLSRRQREDRSRSQP